MLSLVFTKKQIAPTLLTPAEKKPTATCLVNLGCLYNVPRWQSHFHHLYGHILQLGTAQMHSPSGSNSAFFEKCSMFPERWKS